MDEYLIGAGALLTAGSAGSIAPATLHAEVEPRLAGRVEAALIDFESSRLSELSRILIVAAGWSAGRFRREVVRRLLARRECELADVVEMLAQATGSGEIHLFAHWACDDAAHSLEQQGLRVVAHPLEAVGQAALVCGQRIERWPSRVRAA